MNRPPDLKRAARLGTGAARKTASTSPKPSTPAEAPEHGNRWPAFVVWAVMGGWCSHLRLVERIVAELEQGGADA